MEIYKNMIARTHEILNPSTLQTKFNVDLNICFKLFADFVVVISQLRLAIFRSSYLHAWFYCERRVVYVRFSEFRG